MTFEGRSLLIYEVMKEATNPPPGQNNVAPYLVVKNAAGFLKFVVEVFDGEKGIVMEGPEGTVMHGEVRIGESVIMLADSCERVSAQAARLYVYVPDVDTTYQRALAAGAESESEPADQFYGDRSAGVTDPYGVTWYMATHIEDVSPEELEKRKKAMMEAGEG